jgi:hypothetical protein
MALLTGHKRNFQSLVDAFENGDVALMECQLAASGEMAAVVCAANRLPNGEIQFVPFCMMFNDNPYRVVNPPNPDGGFLSQEEVWK